MYRRVHDSSLGGSPVVPRPCGCQVAIFTCIIVHRSVWPAGGVADDGWLLDGSVRGFEVRSYGLCVQSHVAPRDVCSTVHGSPRRNNLLVRMVSYRYRCNVQPLDYRRRSCLTYSVGGLTMGCLSLALGRTRPGSGTPTLRPSFGSLTTRWALTGNCKCYRSGNCIAEAVRNTSPAREAYPGDVLADDGVLGCICHTHLHWNVCSEVWIAVVERCLSPPPCLGHRSTALVSHVKRRFPSSNAYIVRSLRSR